MNNPSDLVALVPARGGSKGIPRKNLARIRGKSLLEYAIRAAIDSGAVSRVVVSSDDAEILAEAGRLGAEPLRRPETLSTDTASSDDVIAHFIASSMPGLEPTQAIALLQPTSPLRTAAHIAAAAAVWRRSEAGAVVSVCEPEHHPAKSFAMDEQGYLRGLLGDDAPFTPRQSLPRVLQPNGAIYIFSVRGFVERGRIPRERLVPFVMENLESLDIDIPADLERAAQLMQGNSQ